MTASNYPDPLSAGRPSSHRRGFEQGVRFIGAASVQDGDRIVVLDSKEFVTVHGAESITGSGSIEAEGLILSIGAIPGELWKAGA